MTIIHTKGNITSYTTDVIVNTANTALMPGGGVCGAIHSAAGPQLKRYCLNLGPCPVGQARITPAFGLKSRWIIHAVGPAWHGGANGEPELLKRAYLSSLDLARAVGAKSIAFPAISTGIFGYPLEQATDIAVEMLSWGGRGLSIFMVCFNQETYDAYSAAMGYTGA